MSIFEQVQTLIVLARAEVVELGIVAIILLGLLALLVWTDKTH